MGESANQWFRRPDFALVRRLHAAEQQKPLLEVGGEELVD